MCDQENPEMEFELSIRELNYHRRCYGSRGYEGRGGLVTNGRKMAPDWNPGDYKDGSIHCNGLCGDAAAAANHGEAIDGKAREDRRVAYEP